MNKRVMTILLSAFVVAALCSYVVYRLLGKSISGPQKPTTQVVVTTRDIPLGTVLQKTDLSTAEIVGTPAKNTLVKIDDAVGRGVVSEIYQGEPVLDTRLAPVGSGGGLAATIPQGMRACAVRVDEVVGVSGFATPGMRVDVLISGTPPGVDSGQGTLVRTLLQNIAVLSAGVDIQKDPEGKAHQVQVVNLLVTPEQAEQLSLASSQTRIQLVLRNPIDQQATTTPGTATARLFSESKPEPKRVASGAPRAKPAPAQHVYLVQVFNGSKRSDEKFNSNEGNQ